MSLEWTRHQDILIDWPSIVTWLWLWHWLDFGLDHPIPEGYIYRDLFLQVGGGLEYIHRSPVSRKRRRKGNPVPESMGDPVPGWYKYENLALQIEGVSDETVKYGYGFWATRTIEWLHCKLQTRPVVREGAPQKQDHKFQTATFWQEVISGRKSHKGAQYQDILTVNCKVTSTLNVNGSTILHATHLSKIFLKRYSPFKRFLHHTTLHVLTDMVNIRCYNCHVMETAVLLLLWHQVFCLQSHLYISVSHSDEMLVMLLITNTRLYLWFHKRQRILCLVACGVHSMALNIRRSKLFTMLSSSGLWQRINV
jgi:hypothetical protein